MTSSTAPAAWRILTPWPGTGAVAAIALEGDLPWACSRLGLPTPGIGDIRLTDFGAIDTGLVLRWSADALHLTTHGGGAVVRAVTRWLLDRGIPEASSRDVRQSFPEARTEIEAHMLAALARAASPLAIDLLLDQPRRWEGKDLATETNVAPLELNRLIDPPLVVALGPSNIGKSTLVNALAGRNVSIVADEPGTTRDHVGVTLDFAGLVVRFVDTPGLRANPDPIEREATQIALDLAQSSDLVLLCGDPTTAPVEIAALAALRVCLRSDLGSCAWAEQSVCAPSGAGLPELVSAIRERLLPSKVVEDPRPWRFWIA